MQTLIKERSFIIYCFTYMAFKWSSANNDQSPASQRLPKTGVATTKGGVLDWVAGADGSNGVAAATSSSTVLTIGAVSQSTETAGALDQLAVLISPTQVWLADLTNNSDPAHNGQRMTLTDAFTVNNTGTDVTTFAGKAIVRQLRQVGVNTDKKALVQFCAPSTLTA